MTQKINELWDDVEMQLELSEGFYEPGNPRFYTLRGFPGIRLSHEDGNDLLSISNSNEGPHEWRTVVEVLSIQRREINGLGGDFPGIALQVRFDSEERKRMVPFLTDIIQLVRSGATTDGAFEATLEDWKGRFRSVRLPLDREKQRGLFGELCVLSNLVTEKGPSTAMAWKGPARSLHDFVSPDWHIEVKTSTTSPGRLKIHPLEQLEPITEDFFLVMVEISAGEGKSLPTLVNEIREMVRLNPGAADHIEKMLSTEGYRDTDAERYDTLYELEGLHSLPITHDTPILHRIRIDPQVACIHGLRWILKTEALDFTPVEGSFWADLVS